MENSENITYWLELSLYDLETAEALLEKKKFLYVGFMCHQSIEKILKGYYRKNTGKTPPYTHNLSYLLKNSGLYNSLSDEQKDIIDTLEPLNIEARYPTYKDKLIKSLTAEKCKHILSKTKELYKWIETKL